MCAVMLSQLFGSIIDKSIKKRSVELSDWHLLCLSRITADHTNNFDPVFQSEMIKSRDLQPENLCAFLVYTNDIIYKITYEFTNKIVYESMKVTKSPHNLK